MQKFKSIYLLCFLIALPALELLFGNLDVLLHKYWSDKLTTAFLLILHLSIVTYFVLAIKYIKKEGILNKKIIFSVFYYCIIIVDIIIFLFMSWVLFVAIGLFDNKFFG